MARPGWITLNDYANQYKVSISTLRRRIRAGQIEFQMEGGRYWLPSENIEKHIRHRPVESPVSAEYLPQEDVMNLAREMMLEIKAAYVHSLQDKEEQILRLKNEVADLKTLVKILEVQPHRMAAPIEEQTSEELDLEVWS